MMPQGMLSQREVARRLGISHALVAQIERSAVNKICVALDLPSPYTHVGGKRGWQRTRRNSLAAGHRAQAEESNI